MSGFEAMGKKRNPTRVSSERVADLEEMDRKRIEIYQIYGLQEPGPLDPPRVRTRRGRVV